jgi:hypothetical protein
MRAQTPSTVRNGNVGPLGESSQMTAVVAPRKAVQVQRASTAGWKKQRMAERMGLMIICIRQFRTISKL